MLREADNSKKAPNLEHLKKLPCKYHCDFRDQCARAYELHLRGVINLRKAKILISESMDDDEEALELLNEAEKQLYRSRPETLACHDLQTKRRAKLNR